jgi:hypothetical protein
MTTFDPSLAALDRPDQLGGALQQGLPRPMSPSLTWSLIQTFFLGGITGGIVPIFLLPKRFHDFAVAEQLQFWHLAEWLRLQTGDSEASAATEAAKRVTPGFGLRLASLAFLFVAIGIACTALPHNGKLVPNWFALTLPQLQLPQKLPIPEVRSWSKTEDRHNHWFADGSTHYLEHDEHHIFPQRIPDEWDRPRDVSPDDGASNDAVASERSPPIATDLVNAFTLAISGAALCWLIEINTHIGRVRRFVGAFNQLSGRYGVGSVRLPGMQLGLRPLWLLGAAATCVLGGYWAVPVMLAAAAHRRYIRSTSLRLRSDLARRQRDVLLARRPPLRVPASTHLMGDCPRDNCRAPNPPEAQYCRRCGTKLQTA